MNSPCELNQAALLSEPDEDQQASVKLLNPCTPSMTSHISNLYQSYALCNDGYKCMAACAATLIFHESCHLHSRVPDTSLSRGLTVLESWRAASDSQFSGSQFFLCHATSVSRHECQSLHNFKWKLQSLSSSWEIP